MKVSNYFKDKTLMITGGTGSFGSTIHTIFFTPASTAICNTLSVPSTFVRTASIGKNSQEGTCFNAAAWNGKSNRGKCQGCGRNDYHLLYQIWECHVQQGICHKTSLCLPDPDV